MLTVRHEPSGLIRRESLRQALLCRTQTAKPAISTRRYIVWPKGFFRQFVINIGDVAEVIYHDQVECALFGDVGPPDKIGEGSLALAQGHDLFVEHKGKRVVVGGIPDNVVYIVFPGSRPQNLTSENINQRVRGQGRNYLPGSAASLRSGERDPTLQLQFAYARPQVTIASA